MYKGGGVKYIYKENIFVYTYICDYKLRICIFLRKSTNPQLHKYNFLKTLQCKVNIAIKIVIVTLVQVRHNPNIDK